MTARPEVETTVERRRAPRAPVTVRIAYSTVDALFSEFTRNINEGGLFIETHQPLALEERVALQFALPGEEEPVRVTGRVVRIVAEGSAEPAGMGVEFEGLGPEAQRRINELVLKLRNGPAAVEGD